MSKKQLKIKLLPNGEIQMETIGIKGKKCLDYIEVMQKIANIKIEKQEFKDEYYEEEQNIIQDDIQNITLRENG